MPNPVAFFEILGEEPEQLVAFYRDVFAWEITVLGMEYALVETDSHQHDADSNAMRYTGADAFMNNGVTTGADETGAPTWRFTAEASTVTRYYVRGINGGIGQERARVSISIQVPDLEATLARVVECGGRRVTEPIEVAPDVWVAEFGDPAGNTLGLIRG